MISVPRVNLRATPQIDQHFWSRVDKNGPLWNDTPCWIWTGAKTGVGYGAVRHDGQLVSVHRLAYETLVGPIPSGLSIDHLCRRRDCVNPIHMEPTTRGENVRRGMHPNMISHRAGKCLKGHDVTEANSYRQVRPSGIYYRCRICVLNWRSCKKNQQNGEQSE